MSFSKKKTEKNMRLIKEKSMATGKKLEKFFII